MDTPDTARILKRLTQPQRRLLARMERQPRACPNVYVYDRTKRGNELSSCNALLRLGVVRRHPIGRGADASEVGRHGYVGLTDAGEEIVRQLQADMEIAHG